MIEIFAVVNGSILSDLGQSVSPTYTRIHYLLRDLEDFPEIKIDSISYKQLNHNDYGAVIYNNLIKTLAAVKIGWRLANKRPIAYFAYPHSLTTVQNRALFRLCKIMGLKILLDIHDTTEQSDALGTGKSLLSKAYERYCFRESAILISSIDGDLWIKLKKDYEISENKTIYVPNAFEEEFIDQYPEPYVSQDGKFNVCYIGGISKNRGVEILVLACSELQELYPHLRLLLLGTYGETMPAEIEQIISTSEFITLKEVSRKDIPISLAQIDLFVMPYNPHNIYMSSITPTKFFEYIGTGKPILCTRCESLKDIGSDGSILYVDYNLEDFKTKIEMLINRPDLREEMSEKLINLRKQHTWKERAKRVHDALIDILE